MKDKIRLLSEAEAQSGEFRKIFADCIILGADGKILLQKRDNPDWISPFGGHVEAGEESFEAMLREIEEEVGATIPQDEPVFLGALTEATFSHRDLVHIYFWHDKNGKVTGCYEGAPIYFNSAEDALGHPCLMDHAGWALRECIARGLLK
ncbi:MAG: hypothetical protein DI551_11260 [Micavibrio aeruginosavorus]|uniref:Nudix hydrolase domain-containing protein n=1 Tax=Micavibrio aeruginosavorus TaxID=349221 RepID=A0A2W5MRH9_9BACT|nr:MAG: hypothetical protein DI551_11260 [Micavibrio aeruginosavorus]